MEKLKSYDEITTVDQRQTYFALRNRITGESRPKTLADHYESVNSFVLEDAVPDKVQSHFNTAKNVLLYTWFAYGFYPVAELYVLSALELALRVRIGEEGLKELKKQLRKQHKQPGMRSFIEHAVAKGWIKNEDFEAYHRAPYEQAKHNYVMEKTAEMKAKGLDSIELDYDEVEAPMENTTDFLGILVDTVHYIRNIHAHGEAMLYPASVWQTFEICTDFVNALFREQ
jgi:hypothetical protein